MKNAALNMHKHRLWTRVCDSHNEAVRLYGKPHTTQTQVDAVHEVMTGHHNAWLVAKHYADGGHDR